VTTELRPQNVFMDRFALEPKVQRVWGVPHATWFTLMGVGGGLFLLARSLGLTSSLGTLLGMPVVDLLSFAAIAVGGLVLIADLGRPWRFWRAFLNVRTSWISWGAICDAIFLICGGLLVLPGLELGGARPFDGLPWTAEAATVSGRTLEIAAGLSAIVVMFYAGAVLANPRAIPYWHSPAVPLQFLFSAAGMSMAVLLALLVANGEPVGASHLWLFVLFEALVLASVWWHLARDRDRPGKSHSIERLTRGPFRRSFVGGVVVVGTLVPALAAALAIAADPFRDAVAVLAVLVVLPAGFFLRLFTLRVGIFPPVRDLPGSPRPSPDRMSSSADRLAGQVASTP
jgi:formate-dependent nitrite reductase membrane component NrfD